MNGAMLAELLRWTRRTRRSAIELPWRALAGALAARRSRIAAAPPAPAMLLALAPAASQGGSGHNVIRLEPRIQLSLRTFSTFSAQSTVVRPVVRSRTRADNAEVPDVRGLYEGVVRRLVTERRRVELPVRREAEATASHAAALAREAGRWSSPPVRSVGAGLRAAHSPELALPLPPRAAAERDGVTAAAEVPPPEQHGAPVAAPPVAPAVDLERLTDQVVRQIDRRIVAHRERVGRI